MNESFHAFIAEVSMGPLFSYSYHKRVGYAIVFGYDQKRDQKEGLKKKKHRDYL